MGANEKIPGWNQENEISAALRGEEFKKIQDI